MKSAQLIKRFPLSPLQNAVSALHAASDALASGAISKLEFLSSEPRLSLRSRAARCLATSVRRDISQAISIRFAQPVLSFLIWSTTVQDHRSMRGLGAAEHSRRPPFFRRRGFAVVSDRVRFEGPYCWLCSLARLKTWTVPGTCPGVDRPLGKYPASLLVPPPDYPKCRAGSGKRTGCAASRVLRMRRSYRSGL